MINYELLILAADLESDPQTKQAKIIKTNAPPYFRWHLGERDPEVCLFYGRFRANNLIKASLEKFTICAENIYITVNTFELGLEAAVAHKINQALPDFVRSTFRQFWSTPPED